MPDPATGRNASRLVMLVLLVMALAACSGSAATAPAVATPAPAITPAPVVATPAVLATPAATKARAKKAPKGAPTPVPVRTAAPVSTPRETAPSPSCPTAGTVGSALGMTVSNPTSLQPTGASPFPAGAKAVVCDYRGPSSNVIIELLTNIAPADISLFSEHFPVPYKSVSGVGDQARSFLVQLGGGKDNEGVVATKGTTLVAITATATPATLTQVEGLVSQLL